MMDQEVAGALALVAAVAGFAYYAWVIAPSKAAEKIEALKNAKEAHDAAEEVRRSKLTPAARKLEDEALAKARADRAREKEQAAAAEEEDRKSRRFGQIVPALVCPHCQAKGTVRRQEASADELVLASNHTYKTKKVTQMFCDRCETKWTV